MADITGTTGDDTLTGTSEPDTIAGLAGNDTLNGGVGADHLDGGPDNDTYYVDDPGDLIIEGTSGGYDNVLAIASYVLGAGAAVEVLSTTNHGGTAAIDLTGNALGQAIIGNAAANTLIGGGGPDTLQGLGGNDTMYVNSDDGVLEAIGGGYDNVLASSSYILAAGVEVEILSTTNHGGTDAINLTGNELGQAVIGNAAANTLIGGGGPDTLQGLGGNDTMYVDSDDGVLEAVGGGYDNVLAGNSFILGAGAEVEILSTTNHGGTTAIDLTGNEFSQVIIGNAAGNTLIGGGGADALQGLDGNDFLFVDANDAVLEVAGGGYDNVLASESFTLTAGAAIEVLSTTNHGGTGSINLTGNEFGQAVIGNAGANTINGGLGADALVGLGGADTFAFTTALGGSNVDAISDFSVGSDKIRLAGASGEPFAALAAGTLAAGTLVNGTAAADANDYLIYNSATGALLYDADGNGAVAAVQFATLATGLALTTADFVVSGASNNPPTISSGTTASIAENSATSTIVYQAAASDADGDRITYALGGNDASLFTIDQNGAVRLVASANYEVQTSYAIDVIASDSNASDTQSVTVTVTDVVESGPTTPIINETASANNSTGTAQAINRATFVIASNFQLDDDSLPSATIRGAVSPATDVDFYSITLQAGEELVLDIDNTPSANLDIVVRIFNSAGQQIGYVDDAPEDPGSQSNYGNQTYNSFLTFRATTSGTYYFSVESYGPSDGSWDPGGNPPDPPGQGQSSGTYDLHVSIGPVATAAQIFQEDVEALISGESWPDPPGPGFNLTYSFPDSPNDYSGNSSADLDGFAQFNAAQQAATTQLLQLIANATSLTFSNVTGPADNTATLQYAENNQTGAAYAYYPGGGPGGTAWFNDTSFNSPEPGEYSWMGILHETGHMMGLKHGHEFPAISFDHNSLEYTVMTYRAYPGDSTSGGYGVEAWGYPSTLMMLDIAALQQIYGANFGYNADNTVYSWSPSTGAFSINGSVAFTPGDGNNLSSMNRVLMTIWDGGGSDTYNLDNYSTATTIDLRPGEWTTTSQVQISDLGGPGVHDARGNVANALQFQGDTRSLIENAIGGSAGDTLIANQATNQLTGNGGADTFAWRSASDAGTASPDQILDFVRGTDHIDLAAIDANSTTAGSNDAFSFIGTAAFSNVAGQLRYQASGANLLIQADLDGNGTADMAIIVNGLTPVTASDFFL